MATTQPVDAQTLAAPRQPVVAKPNHDDGPRGALQLLALLQRDGRLVDFLQEEIDAYTDAQIGAAVRDIHRGCRKVARRAPRRSSRCCASEEDAPVTRRRRASTRRASA